MDRQDGKCFVEIASRLVEWFGWRKNMKKGFNLILEDPEIMELIRIVIDDDAEGALVFLKTHLKGKAQSLLEGG